MLIEGLLYRTPQIPLSSPQGTPPSTNTARLIKHNKLLPVLTANVKKIDGLIALIQVENFDVIGLNESWQYTQNKNLLAEVVIHGYKVFHENK